MKIKNRAKTFPEYSIQFSFDKRIKHNNPVSFLEVSNMKNGKSLKNITNLDLHYFGYCLAQSKLLDKKDKIKLGYLFEIFLKEINKKSSQTKN